MPVSASCTEPSRPWNLRSATAGVRHCSASGTGRLWSSAMGSTGTAGGARAPVGVQDSQGTRPLRPRYHWTGWGWGCHGHGAVHHLSPGRPSLPVLF